MSKSKYFLLSVLFCGILSAQTQLVWDFSKPIQNDPVKFVLRGKTVIKDGALYSPSVDRTQRGGYTAVKIYPELTPQGAFRLTAEFTMGEPRSQQHYLMLWDNKCDFYDKKNGVVKDNSGFTVALSRTSNGKSLIPHAWLGFGKKTAWLKGKPFSFTPGKKYTLVFDYNGSGQAFFSVNGKKNSTLTVLPGGPVAPAQYRTVIGDRVLGHYFPFDGRIHLIKLESRPAQKLEFHVSGRQVFVRNEKNAQLQVLIRNVSQKQIGDLAPGKSKTVQVPVETALMPGTHSVKVSFAGIREQINYRIGPLVHDRIVRLMWDYNDDFRHLQKAGFTHGLKSLAVKVYVYPYSPERYKVYYDELDDMLAAGFRKMDYFNIVHYPSVYQKFPRLSRDGKPIIVSRKMNVDARNPKAIKFLTDIADRTAKLFGHHPAVEMLDVNSEIRDRTIPSFSGFEQKAFKKFAGFDVPEQVEGKTIPYYSLPDFPPARVIPENYPYLVYYRWFWTVGDGWNNLHSMISDAYHRAFKHPFKTYFAPAARQPPIRGVGGKTDMVGQWTYANPDPLRMTAAADELLAVSGGRPVMHGIQLICYRSQTAPVTRKVANEPAWVKKHPKAQYITIPPDALVEGIWAMLSRPIHGMVFHGDGSFFAPPIKGAKIYIMTNPETKPAFEKVVKELIEPLGPALKKVPGSRSKVAILHSFTSAVLAERGTYGWRGWPMDLHLALQWGGLDPCVVYEEDLTADKLDGVKVLFLPHCDVLTENVCRKITAFQQRGGIVVADETVPPEILPQLRIRSISKAGKHPLQAKAELTAFGQEMRQKLAGVYTPSLGSTSSDLVAHARGNYLFVINDKRTYGDYLGPWKMMAEKALSNKGKVWISRRAGAVYDLVKQKPVPFKVKNGKTEIDVDIPGAGGKLFLLTDKPLPAPKVRVDSTGKVTADVGSREILPVQLEVRDPRGKLTDDSHFGVAVNGRFQYQIVIPKDTPAGKWQVTFKLLANGKKAAASFVSGQNK